MNGSANQRTSPAMDRTLGFLRREIDAHLRGASPFLPAVTTLTRACGVSRMTMYAALKRLADEGVVSIVRHRGIFITGSTRVQPPQTVVMPPRELPRQSRAEDVGAAIARDIASGVYQPGNQLPPTKEICVRYEACFRVVARALRLLASRGHIEQGRRSYRVRRREAGRPGASVVVVHHPRISSLAMLTTTPRSPEFWRSMDTESWVCGLRLDIRTSRDTAAGDAVMGYVVWSIAFKAGEMEALLRQLVATRRPVVVFDEGGDIVYPPWVADRPEIRIVRMGLDVEPGRAVGHYLQSLGHRRIGFFGARSNPFAAARLQGIREVYEEMGCCDPMIWYDIGIAHGDAGTMRTDQEILKVFNDRVVAIYSAFVHDSGGAGIDVRVAHATWMLADRELLRARMKNMVGRALRDRSVTAWVGWNDTVALVALSHLRAAAASVRSRVSVVGFDDSLEALGKGLTSYNFGVPATVRAFFDFMLSFRAGPRGMTASLGAVAGHVMQRASSGSP